MILKHWDILLDWTQDLKIFCFRYQKSQMEYGVRNTYFQVVFNIIIFNISNKQMEIGKLFN